MEEWIGERTKHMKLPAPLLKKLEHLLGQDFPLFMQNYQQPRIAALRANGLKISVEDLPEFLPFLEERVPWSQEGYYYNEETVRPAKYPQYYAGLYYIQEPSAMLPAECLQARPGERVLDLCAAPGGKSLQLAAQLGRDGLLVSNDIQAQRAKVLLKNIERYGVVNAIVLNETPQRLTQVFPGFFDKILVDAPCSGEGMFRKEPEMVKDWSEGEVLKYSGWQAEILAAVPQLLRPGGEVIYSTCTFSPEENELQIQDFLSGNPEFELSEMRRLWPHEVKGEGHFVAKMKSTLEPPLVTSTKKASRDKAPLSKEAKQGLADFSLQVWGDPDRWQIWLPSGGQVVERAGHILWESYHLPSLKGLKVLRSGWLLGTIEKGRFRPSVAFALGLPKEAASSAVQQLNLLVQNSEDMELALRYLRGETLVQEGRTWAKGWHLMALNGFPLGWAKGAGPWLKNEYPPGWRWIAGEER